MCKRIDFNRLNISNCESINQKAGAGVASFQLLSTTPPTKIEKDESGLLLEFDCDRYGDEYVQAKSVIINGMRLYPVTNKIEVK